jgi:hypothetical protein
MWPVKLCAIYQGEYSRNLLFQHGARMEQRFQAMVERRRASLGIERIKTILGYQRRPTFTVRTARPGVGKSWSRNYVRSAGFQGPRLTLKVYTQGERVRRLEALVPNTEELDCGRDLSRFPRIVVRLRKTLERFVEVLAWVDSCLIADETLEDLPRSAWVGQSRVGGIDLTSLGCGPWPRPLRLWPLGLGALRLRRGRRRFSPAAKPSTDLGVPPTT